MQILINHLGYLPSGYKIAIIEAPAGFDTATICLHHPESKQVVWQGQLDAQGTVDEWRDWYFYRVNFTEFNQPGSYQLSATLGDETLESTPFVISPNLYRRTLLTPLIEYFQQNRCSGETDEWDKSVGFVQSPHKPRVDVHGGWYDASGDWSKYLSHLSYANYLNPQQIPMVVWSLQECLATMPNLGANAPALQSEMLFGADFLVRMQDPDGYFYMTVFDVWSKDKKQREICAYKTQQGIKTPDWQAGYRQGGGMAIAALARAARLGIAGEYNTDDYLNAAIKGFDHLEAHNRDYLDDGEENIIDDYCALMAAVELYQSQAHPRFADAAHKRATQLHNRLSTDEHLQGWLKADQQGERPFSHSAEEGLPMIAMLNYARVMPNASEIVVQEFVSQQLAFWQQISTRVTNPFLYPRQYCKPVSGHKQDQFFFTHDNESGYWWQGENARLASIAAACLRANRELNLPNDLAKVASTFAHQQLHWLLGLNPFSACMVQGFGFNNPFYRADWPGHTGGVCNGITSSLTNERDIALCETDDPMQNWRWGEQWIPHAAWLLLLLTELEKETT